MARYRIYVETSKTPEVFESNLSLGDTMTEADNLCLRHNQVTTWVKDSSGKQVYLSPYSKPGGVL